MDPRPELILFDAVGTLIEPMPSAGEIYRDFGRRYDCARSDFNHDARLLLAMRQVAISMRQQRDLQTDEAFEYECWRQVVREVFEERSHSEADQLFADLWEHFSLPQHWRLFPDVEPTFAALRHRGYRLGIASNFDGRLRGVCLALPPLHQVDHLFISSQVGWSKPAAGFYQAIEHISQVAPQRILLVGDDCDSDHLAPRGHGWQTRWLRRNSEKSATGDWILSLEELLAFL